MYIGDQMDGIESVKSDIISIINDRQQVTYNELQGLTSSLKISESVLKKGLEELEAANAIASRSSGGILTYYMLQDEQVLNRVMIVEDDRNINKLMALSVGKGFDITQIYDGKEAMGRVKLEKPDLVILDLMLPGADGLEICQSIKTNPVLSGTTVIIVSAMDATSNRFKGIKYGADYYIKKPFDPTELRNLVTIFLKKKGKRFDPLIDLPNEEKISAAIEKGVKAANDYEIGRLKVDGLAEFAGRFGPDSGITILRLVSQLIQDNVRESGGSVFVGFLDADDFVIAGERSKVAKMANSMSSEFNSVLPFIYQNEGYKPIELGIEDTYGMEVPKMKLVYSPIEKNDLKERRSEILKSKKNDNLIGSYTYEELRRMLGSNDLDVIITRDQNGVRLSIGKGKR
jgi:DNA-binding response OmpR family regulator